MERLGADLPADSTAGGVAGRLRWLLTTAGAFVRGSILPPVGSLALLFASMVVLDLANRIAADFGLGYLVIVAGYGVFMGTMIVARTHHLLAYGLCGFAALVITPLLGGVPVPLIVATPMIKTLAVVLAAVIMRSRLGRSTDLARPGVMWRFALVTMIGLPMLPGVTITLVRVWIGQQHIMALLPGIYLANALGCAITAPLVLSLHRGELHAALERGKRLGTVLTLALLCVGTLAVFELSRFQMLFMVLPLMLVVVLRLGLLGACLGCGLVAVIAICMTIAGEGPFSVMAVSPGFQNLRLQIFLAVLCIQSYPLAVVVQTRRSLEMGLIVRETRARFAEAKLRASEELHRALTENASDIVSRFSIDARRLYTSSSVTHILGFKPEELAGQGGLARIHPEDREAYLAVADQMRRGVERIGIVYRHARADGTWVWLESRLRMVRGATGQPAEYISNARDISLQKETEARLDDAMAELSVLATTDGLTGLPNRRRFDDTLRKEWRRAMRAGVPIGIIMADADHFKLFNDTYGHQGGDACLRAIASALVSCTRRPGDMAARYGGEEFAVILPGTTPAGAATIAERMRDAVLALDLPHAHGVHGIVTVSLGVATMVPERHSGIEALLGAADDALYEAKRSGRNRVVAHTGVIASTAPESAPAEPEAIGNVVSLRDPEFRNIA